VKLKLEYPEVASRDKAQQADVAKVLDELGLVSKRTLASEFGYDYDEQQQEIAKEPKTPKPEPMGFGSPFGRPPSRLESLYQSTLKRLTEQANGNS
jgi:hypothetical protein